MSNYQRFLKELQEITKNNKNLEVVPTSSESVLLRYPNKAYISFQRQYRNRGVEVGMGRSQQKGGGLGTRLRNYGVRAARSAGVPLWHYGININNMVGPDQKPISTYIMRNKLGAVPTRGMPVGKWRFTREKWASVVLGHKYPTRSKKKINK
jgi:hypothetical protein